jgi:long-chain acyl-CoA synthetase
MGMNVSALSVRNLEQYGEHDSLYFQGRWYSNREMLDRSVRSAAGLAGLGVKPGDRVATVLANCPEVLNTFVACFWMGAWCMPVMFSLSAEEIGYLFEDAQPTVVVTQSLFLDKVRAAMTQAASIKAVVTVDPDPVPAAVSMPAWFRSMPPDFPMAACAPGEVALLMYTSGTTGNPKGVMISHDNLYFTADSSSRARGIAPGEIFLSCLPLNHSYGIILWASSEAFGLKNLLLPRFDCDDLARHIQEFRCSATSLVPTMMVRLLNSPGLEHYDLSSLKRWGSAAAPLPLEVRRRFESKFPGTVIEAYGLTECSPTVAMNRMGEPWREGSVGRPIPGVAVSIQDEHGKTLPAGATGEICVQGRNVMQGYYHRPEATGRMIREGWLHTGDAGHLDNDGFLYVTDRIKDLIIRGGENIYPKDVEEVLLQCPGVLEAAVIGLPDPDYGEEVIAVIVPAPGATLTEEEVIAFARPRLGKFQVPKRVAFTDSLPKTAIGKILKRELRKSFGPAGAKKSP